MVHPSALTGKTTHSLLDIIESIRDLIFREYNKDAKPGIISYRDPEMPALRGKYIGRPAVSTIALPFLAVGYLSVIYEDAPQNAGADIEAEVKIYMYGSEKRRHDQFVEAIKMAESVRHIILDNPTVPTAEGIEQVYQLGYKTMRVDFSEMVYENFRSEPVGVEVAEITVLAVFAEKGY